MVKNLKGIIAKMLILLFLMPALNINAKTIELAVSNEQGNIDITSNENNVVNEEQSQDSNDESMGKEKENIEENKNLQKENSELEEESTEVEKESTEVEKESTEVEKENIEKEDINEENIQIEGDIYQTKKLNIPRTYSNVDYDIREREEYKLKLEALEDYEVLVNKTDSPFEIALAYPDGSYSYIASANSVESAIEKIANTPMLTSDEDVLPAVINSEGQVVYSTNSMARVYKHINGKPYQYADKNSNVYSDSGLTKAFTYVNHFYMDDAPVLQDNGKSAQLMISGYKGWLNKDTSKSEYDMIVVPINQVKNPSHYYVKDGILYHFVTINSTVESGSGTHLAIGKAPSYLKSGIKYLSYDGIYFYNASNLVNGFNTMISDYKANTYKNSVNSSNPHYTYFKYLPYRSKTNYTAAQINSFIKANATDSSSKLLNIGQALKDAESKYGVNALITLGVAINESAWGTSSIAKSKNNIFGLNAIDSNPGQAADTYSSVAACINEFAKNYISSGYADPADYRYYGGHLGGKANGSNVKYASDPYWAEKAASYAFMADLKISGSVNSLKDTDYYQLGMATTNNTVVNSSGTLLYDIANSTSYYTAYTNTPFIITYKDTFTIGGQAKYEINPERHTSIGSKVNPTPYSGTYSWSTKGYVNKSGVKLINSGKNYDYKSPTVQVIGGTTRYDTAAVLSKSKFTSANTVVLVNGTALSDGLTAAPLSAYYNAPILLTTKTYIPDSIRNEIKRLGAKNVLIIGGELVVGKSVETELKSLGVSSITRIGGETRYDTSLEIAKYIDKNCYDVSKVVVAYGFGESDPLSIAPVAVRDKMPIILVDKKYMHKKTYDWLKSEQLSTAFVIGGTLVVSDATHKELNGITVQDITNNRIGGQTRYDTNALIIKKFYTNSHYSKVYASRGDQEALVDALTAAPIAGLDSSPIILTHNNISESQKTVLKPKTSDKIIQVGLGVKTAAINSIKSALAD